MPGHQPTGPRGLAQQVRGPQDDVRAHSPLIMSRMRLGGQLEDPGLVLMGGDDFLGGNRRMKHLEHPLDASAAGSQAGGTQELLKM